MITSSCQKSFNIHMLWTDRLVPSSKNAVIVFLCLFSPLPAYGSDEDIQPDTYCNSDRESVVLFEMAPDSYTKRERNIQSQFSALFYGQNSASSIDQESENSLSTECYDTNSMDFNPTPPLSSSSYVIEKEQKIDMISPDEQTNKWSSAKEPSPFGENEE